MRLLLLLLTLLLLLVPRRKHTTQHPHRQARAVQLPQERVVAGCTRPLPPRPGPLKVPALVLVLTQEVLVLKEDRHKHRHRKVQVRVIVKVVVVVAVQDRVGVLPKVHPRHRKEGEVGVVVVALVARVRVVQATARRHTPQVQEVAQALRRVLLVDDIPPSFRQVVVLTPQVHTFN